MRLSTGVRLKRKTMARVHIATAGNVEAPAYLTLVALGFDLDCDRNGRWTARKGDALFSAGSPLELLGLAAMYDARGPQWQASDAEIELFLAKVPK
jgi:hypothetical protein